MPIQVPDLESKLQSVVDYLVETLDCAARAEGIETGGEKLSFYGKDLEDIHIIL